MDEKLHITISEATPADVDDMVLLIRELAAYERAPHEATLTANDLLRDGFGPRPYFHALLAKVDGQTVGMAFWYFTYSTWKGKVLYLEDLIVRESWRGKGIGQKLFEELIRLAARHRVKRMQWQVLHWNESALAFYRKYQATLSHEWMNGMLTEEKIKYWVENLQL
ncbi:MAG: hypothetical protein PWR20_478 [Bacteroidales bacterium]|jgi:hypothetical protein|nr:hypothetical protein [Bacteroidales bacterium]MDN5328978.1 hypothetical protein [Bacteroidales bacterium]NLH52894.1 GNAT family N-acetyltransferase [Bacteroidales bacterium]